MEKERKIIEIASEIFDVDVSEIEIDKSKSEYEEWDSLAHVQIAASIADEYNVNIPFEELAHIDSLREFIKYMGD